MYNKKNKVLYLVNIPSPYRIDFFNELGKICDLTVLFERRTSDEREPTWFSSEVKYFKAIFLEGLKTSKNTALSFKVISFLKDRNYDFIVVGGYSTPTGILAINYLKIRGIPFGINADGGLINEEEGFIKRKIKRFLISSADFWLSTSEKTSDYFINYGAKPNKIYWYPFTTVSKKEVISAPVDLEIKEKLKKSLGIKENKVVISVGQFIHRKGFDILLKAWKGFPESYGLYIVGGEPTKEYLDLIVTLGLKNVHFIDFKAKNELADYYKASDIFVLPTREDIWGLVINEAMSFGLPVITTDKCGAGLELVEENKNGYIVPVNNHELLAEKMNEVLKDTKVLEKMTVASLKKVNNFTLENMAKVTNNIFEDLQKGKEKKQ